MIISRISGGLGNQMFQYAAGLALARHHGVPHKCDLGWFEDSFLHQGFELERVFGLDIRQATCADFRSVLGWQGSIWCRRTLGRQFLRPLRPRAWATEPHFHFWPAFRHLPESAYLEGYWQSQNYFQPFASIVRETFTFAAKFSRLNAELASVIGAVDSVSLHVRRGDYVKNPIISAVHGVCPPSYYEEAIRVVARGISNPHFFVFSDDMDWVSNHLAIDYPVTCVDHNRGEESYNDMRLMSMCKHNIIANSSFSWWGAWLNSNPEKIVIAPERWFASYPADTSDLIPKGWVRL